MKNIRIKNKLDSVELLGRWKLNTFGETVFQSNQREAIRKWLDEHPAQYYILRDKVKVSGNMKRSVKREEVEALLDQYTLFSIDISSDNYKDHKLIMGEIIIDSETFFTTMTATANKDGNLRNYMEPCYHVEQLELNHPKVKRIPGSDTIIDYIFTHELFDMVVEFAVFDIPLGIYQENVTVFELRTDY